MLLRTLVVCIRVFNIGCANTFYWYNGSIERSNSEAIDRRFLGRSNIREYGKKAGSASGVFQTVLSLFELFSTVCSRRYYRKWLLNLNMLNSHKTRNAASSTTQRKCSLWKFTEEEINILTSDWLRLADSELHDWCEWTACAHWNRDSFNR